MMLSCMCGHNFHHIFSLIESTQRIAHNTNVWYSLRSILLFVNIDVSRYILVVRVI
jgi:hypothetical protein